MLFLSDEWAAAAEDALAGDDDFMRRAAHARLRLQIVPDDAPEWAQSVTVVVDAGNVSLSTAPDAADGAGPAAEGRAAYATWLAILRHELHPRRAVLTRRLRGRGAVAVVANAQLIDRALDVFREMPVEG